MPARSVPDAKKLVVQLNLKVDVLVINLALSGAVDFILASQESDHVRVVGVLNDSVEAVHIPRVHSVHFKCTVLDDEAKADWLRCVEGVLAGTGTSTAVG